MKVTAILEGLIDSNGHQPIQIRIFNNGKRTLSQILGHSDHMETATYYKMSNQRIDAEYIKKMPR